MNTKNLQIAPEKLSSIFKEFLSDSRFTFIFPTDVVLNSWVDWCITHEEESGVSAIPLERFIAWDKFKAEYVSGSEAGKTSIPSILRKLFVRNLITKNAQSPFFSKIINPEFAKKASSFTDWLAKILPSLHLWFKLRIENNGFTLDTPAETMNLDEEDRDYLELYRQYLSFLNQNNMFEPSWITPDFTAMGKKFLIVYPELLEDYADYKSIFEESEDITTITIPSECLLEQGPECLLFPDSRQELRRTILKIRNLVETKQAEWQDITLSVPSLDIYRPYLEREFTKYCVPFVIRAGNKLTTNCAGKIFTEISNCHSSQYSYDTVRTLLLDEFIPWKKAILIVKENLIRLGQQFRCLCSYENSDSPKVNDIWIEAISPSADKNERELTFYKALKKDIDSLCEATSFENVHKAWDIFKNNFLQAEDFATEANNIISRCITALKELIQIENDYLIPLELTIDNSYDFFLTEISSKSYTPQSSACGVTVYPYKLSAAAYCKYQFVIDASQKNLEIPYKRLSFLTTEKRSQLGLDKEDKLFNVSKAFIRLYAKDNNQFSCAENTFNGFAIAHNYLTLNACTTPLEELDKEDFILNEEKLFLTGEKSSKQQFTAAQKKTSALWMSLQPDSNDENEAPHPVSKEIADKIDFVLKTNRKTNIPCLTQTDMKNFFPCPRKWLYSKVLNIGEDSLDTELMNAMDLGDINHRILEQFFKWCIETQNRKLPLTTPGGQFENEEEIRQKISCYAHQTITEDQKMKFYNSPLTKLTLDAQKENIVQGIMNFLHKFCGPVEEKGFGNCTITATEEWYNAEDSSKNWCYSGKIDCIITGENEEIYIVDFKTGKTPGISSCIADNDQQLGDFQIPLYLQLWNMNHENAKATNALFYSINSATPTIVVQPAEKKGRAHSVSIEQYTPTIELFGKYAESFYNHINQQKLVPVQESADSFTNVDSYSDCRNCTYKGICRTTYSIRKENLSKTDSSL